MIHQDAEGPAGVAVAAEVLCACVATRVAFAVCWVVAFGEAPSLRACAALVPAAECAAVFGRCGRYGDLVTVGEGGQRADEAAAAEAEEDTEGVLHGTVTGGGDWRDR